LTQDNSQGKRKIKVEKDGPRRTGGGNSCRIRWAERGQAEKSKVERGKETPNRITKVSRRGRMGTGQRLSRAKKSKKQKGGGDSSSSRLRREQNSKNEKLVDGQKRQDRDRG